MKKTAIVTCLAAFAAISSAQAPAGKADDTWSNVPPASDDRYTNPRKPLYAGPNGWYNFGEMRAELANPTKTRYDFKGGFRLITHAFTAVSESNNLHVLTLDFESDTVAPGVYEASGKGDAAAKKVQVSFDDDLKHPMTIGFEGAVSPQ